MRARRPAVGFAAARPAMLAQGAEPPGTPRIRHRFADFCLSSEVAETRWNPARTVPVR
jgi:hypothetical protein